MEIRKISHLIFGISSPIIKQDNSSIIQQNVQNEFVGSKASMSIKAYVIPQVKTSRQVSFESRYEKMVNKIVKANNPAKVQLRYDEACCILERLGYTMRHNTGSHIVANIPNGKSLVIVTPHGNQKFVHPNTISDLKKILSSHAA